MSYVGLAIAGSALLGAFSSDRASSRAAGAQTASTQAAIDAQNRATEEANKRLDPFVQAGYSSFGIQPNAPAPVAPLAQQLQIDSANIPAPVPYAVDPGAAPRITRGSDRAARSQWNIENQAYTDYQNYLKSIGQMGLSPNIAEAIYNEQLELNNLPQEEIDAMQQENSVDGSAPRMAGLPGYAFAGEQAYGLQRDYLGMNSPEGQQAFIDSVAGSPEMAEMVRQGEEGILQNNSATGGLRGGDTISALSQFRPSVLQHLINQKYSRLGSMSATGIGAQTDLARFAQASAAGQAAQGSSAGASNAALLSNQGTNLANIQLGRGQNWSNAIGDMGSALGYYMGQRNRPTSGANTPVSL